MKNCCGSKASIDSDRKEILMEDLVVSKFPDVIEIRAVEPLTGFTVRITFTDNSQRAVDLEPYLYGPVFEPIRRDPVMFHRVYVDNGALAWPNGADIDTDTLYYDGPPPWAQTERTTKAPGEELAAKRRMKRRGPKPSISKRRAYPQKTSKAK
jgi:hypothetical protein